MPKEDMKKSLLLVAGAALLFAGCSRIENKVKRMLGSATPTPVATPAPTVTPKMTASPKPTVTPKVVATPKPAMKK